MKKHLKKGTIVTMGEHYFKLIEDYNTRENPLVVEVDERDFKETGKPFPETLYLNIKGNLSNITEVVPISNRFEIMDLE